MKEDEVLKKGAKDVENNKKKTNNNSKQTSNKSVKSKANSTAKKADTDKVSTSKEASQKKETSTSKKIATTNKTAGTKKTGENKSNKASITKISKTDSLEDIFENSAKQVKKDIAKSEKTSDTAKIKVKDGSKKTSSTSKATVTKKDSAAKKISDKVTSSEKSSKIKLNSKDKTSTSNKTQNTKLEDNKKVEKAEKTKKNEKLKKEKIKEVKEETITEKVDEEPEEIDLDVIDKELQRKSTIPDADFKRLIKDSALSIIYFVGVLIFLIFDLIVFSKISNNTFIIIQNIFSFVFLGASITFFEIAYRKDDNSKCIIGIEALFIGVYTLTIPYICQIFKGTFSNFLLSALVIVLGYYFIKACVVFYKKQNRYLRLQENFTVEENDNEFNIDDNDDE